MDNEKPKSRADIAFYEHERLKEGSKFKGKKGDEKTLREILDAIVVATLDVDDLDRKHREASREATALSNRSNDAKRRLAQLRADLDVVLPDVRT